MATKFELYLAPVQQNGGWIKGFDLEKHLEAEGLIDRAFSLEDELVKGWFANPPTYPEEFKDKVVYLWKSKRAFGDDHEVAYLLWYDELESGWSGLEGGWGSDDGPALLTSS